MSTSPTTGILVRPATDAHEHAWITESAHATSAGRIVYVRCPACGVRRVDLQERDDRPPTPLSRPTA